MKLINRILLFLLMGLIQHPTIAQVILYQEQFEGPDMETYQLYDGNNQVVAFDRFFADYISRDLPENMSTSPISSGFEGNVIGFEDTDGAGYSGFPYLATDPIDISGYENLTLTMRFACPRGDDGSIYESTDYLEVEYKIDNGQWQQAHYIQGGSNFNAYYDLDLNGISDGTGDALVNENATDFSRALNDTGTTLQIRVNMGSWGSHEEFQFDDIRVTGEIPCEDAQLDSLSVNQRFFCAGESVSISIHGELNDATAWGIYTEGCGEQMAGTTPADLFLAQPKKEGSTYWVRAEGGCSQTTECAFISLIPLALDTTRISNTVCWKDEYLLPDNSIWTATDHLVDTFLLTSQTTGCDSVVMVDYHVDTCVVTGYSSFSQNPVTLYPNPSSNLFTIEFSGPTDGRLIVYNVLGEESNGTHFTNQSQWRVPHSLKPGCYRVLVIQEQGRKRSFGLIVR